MTTVHAQPAPQACSADRRLGGHCPGAGKPHLALALDGVGACRRGAVLDDERRDLSDGREAHADKLHRLGTIVVSIGGAMAAVEGLGDLGQQRCIQPARRHRDRQLVGLALVARIDGALEAAPAGRDAGAVEHGGALLFQCGERLLQRGRIGVCGRDIDCAHVVALEIRSDQAERGEGTRYRRADDLADAEFGPPGRQHAADRLLRTPQARNSRES
jgi:hypothetical protein